IINGPVGSLYPARQFADAAWRALNDSDAIGFEGFNYSFRFFPIGLSEPLFIRTILVIVHPVASRGNCRLKPEAIIGHGREEPGCPLAAPTELAHSDLQLRNAHR